MGLLLVDWLVATNSFYRLNLNSFSFYIVLFFMYIFGELGTILHHVGVINITSDLERENG